MSRLLAIGSSNTDFVFGCDHLPEPGETLASTSFDVYAGGKGANQAVAAARAGASVWLAGGCGDDQNGRDRLDDLQSAGVDINYVAVRPGVPSGLAFITVDRAGENSIVTFDGANQCLLAADIHATIDDLRPDFVATTLEPPEDTVTTALKAAREAGAFIIVTAAPFSTYVASCAGDMDVLIANHGEAMQLLENSGVSEIDAGEAAVQLAGRLECIVIMSVGNDGAVVASREGSTSIPAVPVDVVDTTGAGDALSGTFAAWLAGGADIDTAVRAGVVAGSLATTAPGAQSAFPNRDLIEQVMARQT